MADANVDLGATDIFGLGGSFHAQSSSTEGFSTESVALASDGDVACTNEHDKGTNVSATYKYCGSTIKSDLGTLLTAFGGVSNSYLVTGIDISFSAGEQPEVTVTGHNHLTNAHGATNPPNTFDVSAALSTNAIAVGTISGTNAEQTSSSISFSMNHIDVESTSGHYAGESVTARGDATVEYVGNPGTLTWSAWSQVLKALSDGNEELDTASVTAHKYFDAT